MSIVPLSARRWATLYHLSVVVLIPLLLLFFNIPSISGVNGVCAFKPMRGCNDHARLILLFPPVLAVIQILLGIVAAIQALRGLNASYPKIK
jgi:hypothetical protein